MLFPQIKKSKVKYHRKLMALEVERILGGLIYVRKYYLVTYEDASEQLFFTTNEPDSANNLQLLDTEFHLVLNLTALLDDFKKKEFISYEVDAAFYCLPKYIYYDIILIDSSIKPFILAHLKGSISGYTKIDFNENEKKQLKLWLDNLSASF